MSPGRLEDVDVLTLQSWLESGARSSGEGSWQTLNWKIRTILSPPGVVRDARKHKETRCLTFHGNVCRVLTHLMHYTSKLQCNSWHVNWVSTREHSSAVTIYCHYNYVVDSAIRQYPYAEGTPKIGLLTLGATIGSAVSLLSPNVDNRHQLNMLTSDLLH